MTQDHTIFDRQLLRRRRDRAARQAPVADFLMHHVASDFAERLDVINRRFTRCIDVGAGNGALSERLRDHPSVGFMVAMEGSPGLLDLAAGLRVQADEEALPLADASVDLIVSALALHTVNDLPGALAQMRRALVPDGLLLCALLGGQTLTELRQALTTAEIEIDGGASPRVAPFADVRQLGALLQRAGLALPVADADTVLVTYQSPIHLMHDLRAMGATNVLLDRSRAPMTRRVLARACEIYADRFSNDAGKVCATFEIVTLTAWAPHESQQQPLRPGSGQRSLVDVLETKKKEPR